MVLRSPILWIFFRMSHSLSWSNHLNHKYYITIIFLSNKGKEWKWSRDRMETGYTASLSESVVLRRITVVTCGSLCVAYKIKVPETDNHRNCWLITTYNILARVIWPSLMWILSFYFSYISNEVISIISYVTSPAVDSCKEMVGTFSPQLEPYTHAMPEETTPSGLFARGSYSARTKVSFALFRDYPHEFSYRLSQHSICWVMMMK